MAKLKNTSFSISSWLPFSHHCSQLLTSSYLIHRYSVLDWRYQKKCWHHEKSYKARQPWQSSKVAAFFHTQKLESFVFHALPIF